MDDKQEQNPKGELTLWQIIVSVLGAAFGVQKNEVRERDFNKAKPSTYIIAGLIFTLLFILCVAGVVKLVLATAT